MHAFFIGSPLQYLCAIEACKQFDITPSKRLLIIYQYGENAIDLFQTISLWDRENWPNVYFLPNIPKLRNFYVLPWLNKVSNLHIGKVKKVFIAHDRLLFRHFINQVKANEVWLLDDGVGSLTIAQKRINFEQKRKNKITGFILQLMGIKSQPIEKLDYFSSFPVVAKETETVVTNQFLTIKEQLSKKDVSNDTVILLGQPLIEAGVVSYSDYNAYLVNIAARHVDNKILYYAHRREENKHLNIYDKVPNIEVVKSTKPIELTLLELKKLPNQVLSFYSAALITLPLIYGQYLSYISYKIPSEGFLQDKHRVAVDLFYEKLNQSHVTCMNLSNIVPKDDNLAV